MFQLTNEASSLNNNEYTFSYSVKLKFKSTTHNLYSLSLRKQNCLLLLFAGNTEPHNNMFKKQHFRATFKLCFDKYVINFYF